MRECIEYIRYLFDRRSRSGERGGNALSETCLGRSVGAAACALLNRDAGAADLMLEQTCKYQQFNSVSQSNSECGARSASAARNEIYLLSASYFSANVKRDAFYARRGPRFSKIYLLRRNAPRIRTARAEAASGQQLTDATAKASEHTRGEAKKKSWE